MLLPIILNEKDIPIGDVLQAFKTSPDIIKNLEYLVVLGLIEVDHSYRGTIRLTMHGKHTNIP